MGGRVNHEKLDDDIRKAVRAAKDPLVVVEQFRALLHELSPRRDQPVDLVRWVPVEQVEANDYNPNSVAKNEMRLLHTSISHDGFTQPIVVIWDEVKHKYVVVDGFHRYTTARVHDDVRERLGGMVPIVVLDKSINDRMASTVRHNRARGKHSIRGVAAMVFEMLHEGWSDERVCAELGLETEEMLRLKHVTGFSKLFENVEYKRAWETRRQIELRREWKDPASARVARQLVRSSETGKSTASPGPSAHALFARGPHRFAQGSLLGKQVDTMLAGESVHVLYSDPPWGDGYLKMFATHTEKATGVRPAQCTYTQLLDRLVELIETYVSGHVFVETSAACRAQTEDALRAVVPNVRTVATTYGANLTAVLIWGSRAPLPPAKFDVKGKKGIPFVKECLRSVAIPGAIVLDPCCGSGYTAAAAASLGMVFRGNELNPARLEKAMARFK